MNWRNLLVALCVLLNMNVMAQYSVPTPISPDYDVLWGDTIHDPYRWMEIPESDSLKEWLKAQQKLKETVRHSFDNMYFPAYRALRDLKYLDYPTLTKDGPYFFFAGLSLVGNPVLYYRKEFDGRVEIAYDPNKYFAKQDYSLATYALSENTNFLAVGISTSGSDWIEIRVVNLKTGMDLNDHVTHCKFSNIEWYGSGFFYQRFTNEIGTDNKYDMNIGARLCYHKLGDDEKNDVVIEATRDDVDAIIRFSIVNHKYLMIADIVPIHNKKYNVVSYVDLEQGIMDVKHELILTPANKMTDYRVIGYRDSTFLIYTNFNAPHYRVLGFYQDTTNLSYQVIPEYQEVLTSAQMAYGYLIATYFYKGNSFSVFYDSIGKAQFKMNFSKYASASGFSKGPFDSTLVYKESSFFSPPVSCVYNVAKQTRQIIQSTIVAYAPELYTTKYVEYKSKDGTDIPMYLTYKKDLDTTKPHPVLLYGYGGFGISLTPYQSYQNILLFNNHAILAVPLIRGGGELGSGWHEDGMRLKKQNSYDDFIAGAEYLINNHITTKNLLAIKGASNGGLLVGAMLTQRPDLFKVAIAQMGVYDMLHYDDFTGGRFLKYEFGSAKDSLDYLNLKAYSPLQNIKDSVDYPATLIVTAENDDRAPAFHSYKFLAALQQKSSGSNPHILYYQEKAGHYGSKTYEGDVEEEAFAIAFMFKQMGIKMKY